MASIAASTNPQAVKDSASTQVRYQVVVSPEHLAASDPVATTSQCIDSKLVRVLPNETLSEISLKNFGKYDKEALAMVRDLNPRLTNPDLIKAGQMIRVPGAGSMSHNSSSHRRGRHSHHRCRSEKTMSKNFELMQEAQTRLDMPAIGEPKPRLAPINCKTNGDGKGGRFNLEDEVSREESFKLVQNIFLLRREESPRVVAFAGIDSGNGCSSICVQVAEILASQKIGSVCLVDANFHSPSLPDFFGVSNHHRAHGRFVQRWLDSRFH